MGTNCAPLLADLFVHSNDAEFAQKLLRKGENNLAQLFNDTSCYIDDVLSLNTKNLLRLKDPSNLVVKHTAYSPNSAS